MRKCSTCRKSEKEVLFYKTGSYCKSCKKEYDEKNKSHIKEVRRAHHIKNRDKDNDRSSVYYWSKDKLKKHSLYETKHFRKWDPNYEEGVANLITKIKRRAKVLSVDFNLDEGFITSLYESQNGYCAVSGLEFDTSKTHFRRRPLAPSLDRIDSAGGYTTDNVRFVCTIVNMAINEFGDDLFDKMCESYIAKKRIL